MHVLCLRLKLRPANETAARGRRALVDAMLERLRRHFNVAVAESERIDRNGEGLIAFVTVARTRAEASEILGRVAEAVSVHPDFETTERRIEG